MDCQRLCLGQVDQIMPSLKYDQIRVSNFILPQCVQVPSHVNQLLGKSKVLIEAEDEKDGHDHVVVWNWW